MKRHNTLQAVWILVSSALLLVAGRADAQLPLHGRIDQVLDRLQVGPLAARTSDAEFLRRVYLDLTGIIPSVDEARKFLDDSSADKRTALIDHLLASPSCESHLANMLDVMIMERRADKHVKANEWQTYLISAVKQNKPFNRLASEILAADGVESKQRAQAKFYLEREVEPHLLTREVGRIFFGMDLECAQCHDHPLVPDYFQSDYYGLYAFLQRSYLFQPDTKKPAVIAEKADGSADYKSVFTDEEGSTRPRLPGGKPIDEPQMKKGDEYKVKPNPKKKTVRPVPKYSRRAALAKLAEVGANRAFNRNIVNRLWAHMMGHGLVEPVDMHHPENPPTHPELLEMLADEFVATGYDIKAMLRELARSDTYQRSSSMPDDLDEHATSALRDQSQLKGELEPQRRRLAELDQSLKDVTPELAELQGAYDKMVADLKRSRASAVTANDAFRSAQVDYESTQKQLAATVNSMRPLEEATAHAKQAQRSLPNDRELASVIQRLQSASDALPSGIHTLANNLVTQQSAVSKANETQLACENQLKQLQIDTETADRNLAACRRKHDALVSQVEQVSSDVQRSERRVFYLDALSTYGKELDRPAPDSTALDAAFDDLRKVWTKHGLTAPLKPLSPEQMAASVIQATGAHARHRAAAEAEINKKKPLKPNEKNDPKKLAQRAAEIEKATNKKLNETTKRFVALFGAAPGQPQDQFFATADQALFFANGSTLRSWLGPSGGNLVDRVTKLDDPTAAANELYLSVLIRRPATEEVNAVRDYLLARPKDKSTAVQELAWAILTSAEFRFNH